MITQQELDEELNDLFDTIRRKSSIRPPIEIDKNLTLIDDFTLKCNKFRDCLVDYINGNNNRLSSRLRNRLRAVGIIQKEIITCLECFLSGDIKSAYDSFESMLEPRTISRHIENICIPLSDLCNDEEPLFRVRKSDKPLSTRKDMFHIPFNQRHLVRAQRFSVAGLPCLYLGTSLYICWREMDKPDFDKLYISAYKVSEDDYSMVLNLGPDFLYKKRSILESKRKNKYDFNTKLSYLALWPLIIACNYLKKYDNASFVQEYIIPNLLMQWISRNSDEDVIGIAYRSTKLPANALGARGINVVLPPKVRYEEMVNNEFCPNLAKIFKFTLPVSWQVLKTVDYIPESEVHSNREYLSKRLRRRKDRALTGSIDDEILSIYPLTDFYKLETCMDEIQIYDHIKP
ncbi:hypothetical protein ACI2I2_16005 [Scandinavium sp. NPDC088450]|uniref:hypothetical protein n=1 Tax=Scandinavium sp. NPDC088450 TaxID=3364514 RepID=UPI00384C5050